MDAELKFLSIFCELLIHIALGWWKLSSSSIVLRRLNSPPLPGALTSGIKGMPLSLYFFLKFYFGLIGPIFCEKRAFTQNKAEIGQK